MMEIGNSYVTMFAKFEIRKVTAGFDAVGEKTCANLSVANRCSVGASAPTSRIANHHRSRNRQKQAGIVGDRQCTSVRAGISPKEKIANAMTRIDSMRARKVYC